MNPKRNQLKEHCVRYYAGFLLFLLLISSSGCAPDSPESIVLSTAHPLDTSHPNHLALEYMAEDLAERSGGSMRLELYANGQLGSSRELLELLQVGSVDITVAAAATVENFVPENRVFGLPYLFRDRAHRHAFFRSEIGDRLLRAGEKQRLRGMAYFDAGSRSFYTKDAVVDTPLDLEGKKIRVMNSPMAISAIRALGGSPTPINWGELYTALQQGVVDAAENNPPSFVSSRHYEITPYFSLDEHTAVPDLLLIGEESWMRLSEQQRAWLLASAHATAQEQYRLWAAAEDESLELLHEAGVMIHRPDKAPFVQAVEPLYKDLAKRYPEMMATVETIRKVQP